MHWSIKDIPCVDAKYISSNAFACNAVSLLTKLFLPAFVSGIPNIVNIAIASISINIDSYLEYSRYTHQKLSNSTMAGNEKESLRAYVRQILFHIYSLRVKQTPQIYITGLLKNYTK